MFCVLLYYVIYLTYWISYWIHDILPMKYLTWQMFNSYFCNILHIMYSISYFSKFLLWEILTSSVSYTCSFQTFCMDSYNFQPAQIWPCFRIPYFYDIIFLLYCWHDLTFRWSILLQWYHFLTIGMAWSYFLVTELRLLTTCWQFLTLSWINSYLYKTPFLLGKCVFDASIVRHSGTLLIAMARNPLHNVLDRWTWHWQLPKRYPLP